jgi:hypothetical protein
MVFSRLADADANTGNVKDATSNQTNKALFTYYEACWMTDWGQEYSSDEAMITEDVSATCTDVIDGSSTYGQLASDAESTGNNPAQGNGSFRYGGGLSSGNVQAPSNLG